MIKVKVLKDLLLSVLRRTRHVPEDGYRPEFHINSSTTMSGLPLYKHGRPFFKYKVDNEIKSV